MNFLQVKNISHTYPNALGCSLKDVSLTLNTGEIGCLLGPSGCGKTTVLRCLAGLETIDQGTIHLGNNLLSKSGFLLSPEKRRVAMVFQDYGLFPHMSVRQNIEFAVSKKTAETVKVVSDVMDTVELGKFAARYPHQLSGGQKQRVALARALVTRPQLLLLDEPFSNLDIDLRERMKREVKQLLTHYNLTALLVTHNQDEAFDIADSIGVIDCGVVLQWGDAYKLYHQPNSKTVAEFLGKSFFIDVEVNDHGKLITELGEIPYRGGERLSSLSNNAKLLLRPEDIVHDDHAKVKLKLVRIKFRGMYQIYELELQTGGLVECFTSSHHHHSVGSYIGVKLDAHHTVIF